MAAEEHVAEQQARSDVVDALGRVLSSPMFARSERSRAFLSYVVSESVAGRGDRISERTVARGALGRGPAFDGLGDSSVRVTATRVRRALERYYAPTARGSGFASPCRQAATPRCLSATSSVRGPRPLFPGSRS